jgi:hypothetical protein
VSNATLQMREFSRLLKEIRHIEVAQTPGLPSAHLRCLYELSDLLGSIFDMLDNLQTRVNALATQIESQQSRGGNELPTP